MLRQLSVPRMSRSGSKRSSQISVQADQPSGNQQTGDNASQLSQALLSPASDALQTKYRRPLYVQVDLSTRRTCIIVVLIVSGYCFGVRII